MKHSIPHNLDHALALRVTRKALDAYKAELGRFDPQGVWERENRARIRFTVAGKTLSGVLEVLADRVDVELDVPLVFRPFRNQAVAIIEREIRAWVDRARKGEFDAG